MDYTIRDSLGNTAVIRDQGAELKSFCTGGEEYIWQGEPGHWEESAPFLFPIASNVRGDQVWIVGKPYAMGQHGFARKLCWSLIRKEEDSAAFCLRETPETLACYPFRFSLTASYTIRDGALDLEILVKNEDSRPMPYCLGTHPGFCVPFAGSDSGFEDYRIVFEKPEENSCPLYDGQKREINVENRASFLEPDNRTIRLNYDAFRKVDTIIFDKLSSRSVDLTDSRTGKALTLAYENFDYIAFWTDGGRYLCIEPWQGLSTCSDEDDNFLSKRGVQVLQPGETGRHALHFSVK